MRKCCVGSQCVCIFFHLGWEIYWTWIWCCRSGNNTTLRCSLCAKLRGCASIQPTIHHPSIHTYMILCIRTWQIYREICVTQGFTTMLGWSYVSQVVDVQMYGFTLNTTLQLGAGDVGGFDMSGMSGPTWCWNDMKWLCVCGEERARGRGGPNY